MTTQQRHDLNGTETRAEPDYSDCFDANLDIDLSNVTQMALDETRKLDYSDCLDAQLCRHKQ